MLVACDIDGTLAAFPDELGALLQSLRAAGHTVHVVTGTDDSPATTVDCAEKAAYLQSLGCGECWDAIAVLPPPHAENKAAYLQDVGASVLIDNSKDAANAASDVCLVLVPWQTRK